ncbi:hypothetical protein KFE96_00650 [Kordiimonas sp. SCSIO 12603]|uniref:hypothetical protein n=1 Tax=Kordiimonas sp. SCSIO 12603 TaxID=2829596 RepID=UPI0021079AEC|nr:hypothetical protein [Kordiimonas sp. SCSIO 12603]UTW58852.1 hypothetical protein KFE96_00650 [Kordiimonas sp. SCSIO 12603]
MKFRLFGLLLAAFSLSACEQSSSSEPGKAAVIMLARSSGLNLSPVNMENFRCSDTGDGIWECSFIEVVPARGPYPETRRQQNVRITKTSSGWTYAR